MLIGVYISQVNPLEVMPEERSYAITAEAKMQGCEVIFFEKSGVNYQNRTITGMIRKSGTWMEKTMPLPDVLIDEALTLLRELNKDIPEVQFLATEIPLLRYGLPNKLKMHDLLVKAGKYKEHIPAYSIVDGPEVVFEFLNKYGDIVLKPVGGNQGRGIAFVHPKKSYYHVYQHTTKHKFNKREFSQFVSLIVREADAKDAIIVQPYLECRTKFGEPYDFRIHIQRDGNGEWALTKIYPRIGNKRSILSNISRGGITTDIDYFLDLEYGDRAQEIHDTLVELALEITEHVNDFYPYPLDEVGVDLAIDKNEHIWLYEVNAGPQTKHHEWERAKNTIAYAIYIANRSTTKELTSKLFLLSQKLGVVLDMLAKDSTSESKISLLMSFFDGFSKLALTLQPRYSYLKDSEIEFHTESILKQLAKINDGKDINLVLNELHSDFKAWQTALEGAIYIPKPEII